MADTKTKAETPTQKEVDPLFSELAGNFLSEASSFELSAEIAEKNAAEYRAAAAEMRRRAKTLAYVLCSLPKA